jgi:hypothetical protein
MHLACDSPIHDDLQDEDTCKAAYIYFVIFLTSRPSIVRFRLPLTPPQGIEMPPKATLYREVGTQDPSADVPKVNKSASKWTKTDLLSLGVDYQYLRFDDIQIGIKDTDIPPEFRSSNIPSTID